MTRLKKINSEQKTGIKNKPVPETVSMQNLLNAAEYTERILKGDRVALSKAITLVESSLRDDKVIAREIIEKCLPFSGKSTRIGITGIPGSGKSTFIEAIGKLVTGEGKKLAILAIDPSSERSKGSILGDKTRMEELSAEKNAFIRPSPSSGSLGGVANKTREAILLCEAAGFDTIFVETVGVGQSETSVHSMTDCFLLLMIAGAGDELQGIKRGIMERADLIVVNKADGTNIEKTKQARGQLNNIIQLFPAGESKWRAPVLTCSSLTKEGIPEVWGSIRDYFRFVVANGYFSQKRTEQAKSWFHENLKQSLLDDFYSNPEIASEIKSFEAKVIENKMTPLHAAGVLLKSFQKK